MIMWYNHGGETPNQKRKDHMSMDKTDKKKRIVTCCIVLAVVLLVIFVIDLLQYNTGVVSGIAVVEMNDNALELQMAYLLPVGGYSAREVSQNEGEHTGNGMTDYDGSLGQYRIMIEFGDVEPHAIFVRSMFRDGIYELKRADVSLKMKISQPSDHGFVLYIGSDTPIHLDDINDNKLSGISGTIKIPVTIG